MEDGAAVLDPEALRWLRAARLESGLSQKELARLSGLARTSICNIERGFHKPSKQAWENIVLALRARRPRQNDVSRLAGH